MVFGATAIAAYGIRARKKAPVSTTIEWNELAKDFRFDYFNVQTVPQRIEALRRDPWADFASIQQKINDGMFEQLGIPNQR